MTTEVTSVSSVSGGDADSATTGSDYVSHALLLTDSLQHKDAAVQCIFEDNGTQRCQLLQF